ncbi:MAG TPA: hypothetical protein PLO53_11900 [Candidatus Hydrogenedentes bacterium]|mgnify:CR=1 FL=1|nr:hypothetical protein [Candidatus Hydrogenedentota bacterium]
MALREPGTAVADLSPDHAGDDALETLLEQFLISITGLAGGLLMVLIGLLDWLG